MNKIIALSTTLAISLFSPLGNATSQDAASVEQFRAQAGLQIAAQGNLALRSIIEQHTVINWAPIKNIDRLPRLQTVPTAAQNPCPSTKSNTL